MSSFIYVGLGGAIGAILRYVISLLPMKGQFPFLTLCTNFIGAVFIGIVVGLFEAKNISSSMNLFLKTGVCGGFTTFSTFSLESLTLFENGQLFLGVIYVLMSVIGCILGVLIGKSVILR